MTCAFRLPNTHLRTGTGAHHGDGLPRWQPEVEALERRAAADGVLQRPPLRRRGSSRRLRPGVLSHVSLAY